MELFWLGFEKQASAISKVKDAVRTLDYKKINDDVIKKVRAKPSATLDYSKMNNKPVPAPRQPVPTPKVDHDALELERRRKSMRSGGTPMSTWREAVGD